MRGGGGERVYEKVRDTRWLPNRHKRERADGVSKQGGDNKGDIKSMEDCMV